ncbi:MAG: hypothetical protein RLZZ362_2607, partial [Actinomycetota bacterium]
MPDTDSDTFSETSPDLMRLALAAAASARLV